MIYSPAKHDNLSAESSLCPKTNRTQQLFEPHPGERLELAAEKSVDPLDEKAGRKEHGTGSVVVRRTSVVGHAERHVILELAATRCGPFQASNRDLPVVSVHTYLAETHLTTISSEAISGLAIALPALQEDTSLGDLCE